ncbi:MAG: phospholipase D-like domain-containing protein DpdK, partial [Fimbriimonadaceae bacterium]
DIELLDNRARQFSAISPDWPAAGIRLSSIICTLIERGSHLVLIARDVDHNRAVVKQICDVCPPDKGRLTISLKPEVHEKGILGEDYLLSGSMNLTYSGVNTNDEHLTLRTDPKSVEEWRVSLEQKWAELLK